MLATTGITQGPFSLKVIYSDALKKPFLIESSCCCHSGNDTWVSLARSCVGYTQIEVVLNAYVRPDRYISGCAQIALETLNDLHNMRIFPFVVDLMTFHRI